MCQGESAGASDAVGLAHTCFEQITLALQDAIKKAERLGARDMIERLNAAKAAADRGCELTEKLSAMLELGQLDGGALPSD